MARTHGLRSTYTHGCHCPQCTEAEREYSRRYRAGVRAEKPITTMKYKDGRRRTDGNVPLEETLTRTEVLMARGIA